jgi:AcrR family transcriptional regulator
VDVNQGLRERKKAKTRQTIAGVAAELFAEHGYDAVTMLDVARAADVSDQTVYNHFPTKPDLVLDLAEEIRGWYHDAVADRGEHTAPSAALESLVKQDIERFRCGDLDVLRGQFLAQSVTSPVLRRFVLEERERQVNVITEAIVGSTRGLPRIVARSYAAAIVAVIQVVHDQIGTNVLNLSAQDESADEMHQMLRVAFSSLDRTFTALTEIADSSPAVEVATSPPTQDPSTKELTS